MRMTLKRFCKAVGICPVRTWKKAIAKIQPKPTKTESIASTTPPATAVEAYHFEVQWTGATRGKKHGKWKYWVDGVRIRGALLRNYRVYIAGKRNPERHDFMFLPNEAKAGVPVYVNGQMIGNTEISYAPGSEWELADDLVTQCRVEMPISDPWPAQCYGDVSDG